MNRDGMRSRSAEVPTPSAPQETHEWSDADRERFDNLYGPGDFILDESGLLGKGGQGAVILGEQETPDGDTRPIAVKFFRSEETYTSRLRREAEALADVSKHPYIVEILGILKDEEGSVGIAMEYLEGQDGVTFFEEQREMLKGNYEATITILAEIALAIEALHRKGLIYRDLKPQNIHIVKHELGSKNFPYMVKLLDFGLVGFLNKETDNIDNEDPLDKPTRLANSKETQQGVMGTPQFFTPEAGLKVLESVVNSPDTSIGTMSDVYSIAHIGYLVLSGQDQLFDDDIVGKHRAYNYNGENKPIGYLAAHALETPTDIGAYTTPSTPFEADVQRLIMKGLSKDPKERSELTLSGKKSTKFEEVQPMKTAGDFARILKSLARSSDTIDITKPPFSLILDEQDQREW